jgi:hypothetical protein
MEVWGGGGEEVTQVHMVVKWWSQKQPRFMFTPGIVRGIEASIQSTPPNSTKQTCSVSFFEK